MTGDLTIAEDAVQEACAAAVQQWPAEGPPANPLAWLIGVARHKAVDTIRREGRRRQKKRIAAPDFEDTPAFGDPDADDDLSLVPMCCHPALDPAGRVALTPAPTCSAASVATRRPPRRTAPRCNSSRRYHNAD